jgi:hypothetical protein
MRINCRNKKIMHIKLFIKQTLYIKFIKINYNIFKKKSDMKNMCTYKFSTHFFLVRK